MDVQCEYCGKTFKKGALKRHMQAKDPDKVEDKTNFFQRRKEAGKANRVVCPTCDKEMRKDALTRHTKRSHS
jgi:PHP family Zn ribbon phosphoesterase